MSFTLEHLEAMFVGSPWFPTRTTKPGALFLTIDGVIVCVVRLRLEDNAIIVQPEQGKRGAKVAKQVQRHLDNFIARAKAPARSL